MAVPGKVDEGGGRASNAFGQAGFIPQDTPAPVLRRRPGGGHPGGGGGGGGRPRRGLGRGAGVGWGGPPRQPVQDIRGLVSTPPLPGPGAPLMLAGGGGEVIKIEGPGGEDMRAYPPQFDGMSAAFT